MKHFNETMRRAAFDALEAGDLKLAADSFEKFLELCPGDAIAQSVFGNILKREGRFDEALARHREAVRLNPGSGELHSNLGASFLDLGHYPAALRSLQEALRLEPTRVEFVFNFGTALLQSGDYIGAIEQLRRGLELDANHYRCWTNIGSALRAAGAFEASVEALNQAVELAPRFAEARWNLGLGQLMLGNYEQGWENYEWRRAIPEIPIKSFNVPDWDGQPTNGVVVIHAEQGFGDTFQFSRFLTLAEQRVRDLVFLCPPQLKQVLSGLDSNVTMVCSEDDLPEYDRHLPLMSLPRVLGVGANIGTAGPYMRASAVRRDYWRTKLGTLPGPKVGLCWQGNPGYRDDARRSIELTNLLPLSKCENLQFISLQKGKGLEQLQSIGKQWDIIDWSPQLDAEEGRFVDSAAILSEVSLLITSDTAVAHLAGALGVEVWLLLADVADWRWGCGDLTPWYSDMKLIRQSIPGDWDSVVSRVVLMLRERFSD